MARIPRRVGILRSTPGDGDGMRITKANRRYWSLALNVCCFAALIPLLLGTPNPAKVRDGLAWQARGALEGAFRRDLARLERFGLHLDSLVLQAESVGATTVEAVGSPTIQSALEGAVRGDEAPELVSAAVYQDIDADEVSVPFVRLATAAADGAPTLPAIPEDVLWKELEHADATGGTSPLVWFGPDEPSGARLHLVGTAMHEDTEADVARLRLIHVSMPFDPDLGMPWSVRSDIGPEGLRERPVPIAGGAGSGGGGGVPAIAIRDTPRLRWPLADVVVARGRVAPSLPSRLPYGLALAAIVALCLLGQRAVHLAAAAATSSSPDAAAAPVPDAPTDVQGTPPAP